MHYSDRVKLYYKRLSQ